MNRTAASLMCTVVACAVVVAVPLRAQQPAPAAPAPSNAAAPAAPALSQEQLDSLVAPIALYPDQILVQVFMASTYPLDVVEAARFVKANRDKLKGDAMVKAAQEKNWDPSVQSLTAYGQVLEMMNEKLEWTQQLGDAVLADEKAVMATAQRLRQKASEAGNLKSNEQQKVVVQQDKTIIIEPAQPQTVYIPTYNPTVVYGTWWAPAYPPYYYPPPPYYYPGYAWGAAAVGFGVGLAVGAAWGWAGANWGRGEVNIDINNNFTRNNAEFNNRAREGGGKFNHNPSQRKGVAYRDQGTRDKFAATDRNAASARRDYRGHDGGGADRAGDRAGASNLDRGGTGGIDRGTGAADRGGGAGNRAGASPGGLDRGGGGAGGGNFGSGAGGGNFGGSASTMDRGGAGGGNYGSAGASNRAGNYGGSGSFNSGMNRTQAQSYSNRGASSRSSAASHGGARAGGGGGGGARGGGGGGRGGGRR